MTDEDPTEELDASEVEPTDNSTGAPLDPARVDEAEPAPPEDA